jgi:1-phosphofructokinase/tagatose 6-phosphate kinase
MTAEDGCFAHVIDDGARRLFRVRAEPMEPRAVVGSGDALLAGLVAARYTGGSPEECLRFAVACGAESTQHLGAGRVDPARVERLLSEVSIEPVELEAEVS